MTTFLHHRFTRRPLRDVLVDRLWQLAGVLVVALPLASVAAVAVLGSSLWLIPGAVVAVVVAVALSVCT